MASPSGTSSGSSSLQNSDENQRKRKRMISNRESARRSRVRKQKHLDDLMSQVSQLRAENNHILCNMNLVNQLCLNIESENSVLRAQLFELNHRLQALNDIISWMNSSNKMISTGGVVEINDQINYGDYHDHMVNINPWSLVHFNEPIMASSDAFMY
ncbi:hypothetical protein ACJIZ3_002127 [Penstemon smallii]|uniref:BZIP domain-containing protein n=1 Tax=Penstemon smallii TaxID=265156 RepID=A0ABD3U5J8_9LAMI